MMRSIPATLVVALALAACDTGPADPAPEELDWQVTIAGLSGWEHISGTGTVVHVQGTQQFVATATIAGDEAGAVRPWHVHFNTCAEGGGIVGADGDYPRLTVGGAGTATATATVPAALDPAASYHINFHVSVDEMQTIIACGDLVLVTAP